MSAVAPDGGTEPWIAGRKEFPPVGGLFARWRTELACSGSCVHGAAMNVVVISIPDPPEGLTVGDRPDPTVGERDVLIRVKAAGVNRADVIQHQGRYPTPPGVASDIPGPEVAGIIRRHGNDGVRWHPGDAVCALLPGAGHAGLVAVDGHHGLPLAVLGFTENHRAAGGPVHRLVHRVSTCAPIAR